MKQLWFFMEISSTYMISLPSSILVAGPYDWYYTTDVVMSPQISYMNIVAFPGNHGEDQEESPC